MNAVTPRREASSLTDRTSCDRSRQCLGLGQLMNSKAALFRRLVILGIVSLVFLAGCGGGSSASSPPPPPAVPSISSVSPNSAVAGGAPFTLTINGTNFVAASAVNFGGMAVATTFVSATQLTAAISAAAIASAGTAAVTVTNPAPGGGTSNAVSFTITSATNPTPTITTISPTGALAGGPAFTLTVNGTNFVAASTVNFGGMAPTTTFVSATQLTAAIPAAAIGSAGIVPVMVTNPAPGGGTSISVNFTIASGPIPVPTVNSLNPSSACPGGPSFNLFVSGTNFVVSSVVKWNGTGLPTSFFDANTVEAQIPASDIATAGTVTVTVFNPAPGGGSSNPLTFNVTGGEVFPHSVAVDPTGKFVYVANWGCSAASAGSVSLYAIDASTGALTSIGTVAAGAAPVSVAVDPTSKFAYVAGGVVSMYRINGTTGALTPIGALGGGGDSVAVHPSGKFAYVGAGYPADNVSTFAIDLTTGASTFVGTIGAASSHGSNTIEVAIHPSGKFAYAVGDNCALDTFDGEVSIYAIDPLTGALSSTGSPAVAGVCPSSVIVDPFGRFAYVTDNSGLNGHQDDNVAMFAINGTTGALTFIGFAGTGMGPSFVAVDPTGKFAYVTNFLSKDVSMYTIDGTTGALTSIGTIAAGTGPVSVAVDPTGKFAYVANSGSGDVSMYRINTTTGALTPIGTIRP